MEATFMTAEYQQELSVVLTGGREDLGSMVGGPFRNSVINEEDTMAFSVTLLIQKAWLLSLLGDNLMERAGYK
jgi:hypothetical protein